FAKENRSQAVTARQSIGSAAERLTSFTTRQRGCSSHSVKAIRRFLKPTIQQKGNEPCAARRSSLAFLWQLLGHSMPPPPTSLLPSKLSLSTVRTITIGRKPRRS